MSDTTMTRSATDIRPFARLYWQHGRTGGNFHVAADVSLPAAVTVFPDEYVNAPRSWTEQAYQDLISFNEAEQGGHFAAWEQPQIFAQKVAHRVPHAALKPHNALASAHDGITKCEEVHRDRHHDPPVSCRGSRRSSR